MAVLLQNRTISMILTVPDVEVSSQTSTPIIEKLDRSDISIVKHDQSVESDTIPSMPVYHGSIVRIEQHRDDQNVSDLVIRVPNFQRLSISSTDTDSQQPTRIKRRAPICPLLYGPNPDLSTTNNTHNVENLNLSQSRVANANRLTTGLRSLSRAFTHGCKSKRSSSISEITVPSALPDVEVMTEKLETSKSMTPKLTPPKILFVKRKHSKIKTKQPSASVISSDTQTNLEHNRINLTPTPTIITTQYAEVKKSNSPKITSFLQRFTEQNDLNDVEDDDDDDDKEQQDESIRLSFDVEQQFTAISQLISDLPLSSIDADSLSNHRYSTISGIVSDIQISRTDNDRVSPTSLPISTGMSYDFDTKPSLSSITPKIERAFRVQTSILQPDISVIRVGTNDLTSRIDCYLPGEKMTNKQIDSTFKIEQKETDENNIEQGWYGVIHPDDETLAECYDVTYRMDSQSQNEEEDQSSIPMKIDFDPLEYKNLTTRLPPMTHNEYEQINDDQNIDQHDRKFQRFEKRDHSLEHLETILKEQDVLIDDITRNKSRSVDDLSRTSNDQTSTYQPESIADSSSSEISSRHCTLQRSNSYDGFGVYVSTDAETRREHFIRQVEEFSPGDEAGLKENDRILCINGTPVIHEEYTVVLQLIKHGLNTDTLDFDVITNDAYEQFKSQIEQLYQ